MHVFLRGNPAVTAFTAAIGVVALLLASFSLFEPMVTHGQVNSGPFTVTQEVQSELSFLTDANDVTMSGAIQGITGGTAYGTSTFNITTNDPDGYVVTIAFSTTTAMQGIGLSSDISNFTPAVAGVPDQLFTVGANAAEFGYSVLGVTDPDSVDDSFKVSGGTCGSGSNVSNQCWFNKSDATAAEQIVDADGATAGTGATTTIVFQVGVSPNPIPALETGFYIATATLTANVK